MSDHSPPCDLQAEAAVIGAVLLDHTRLELFECANLRAADFVDTAHARIWQVIREERERGNPLDGYVIASRLAQQSGGEPLGLPFVQSLISGAGTGYAAAYFAEIVLDKSRRRDRLQFLDHLQKLLADETDLSVIDDGFDKFWSQRKEVGKNDIGSFAQMAKKETNQELRPIVIDNIVREGETINVVSDSKVGKTWLVHGLALSICAGAEWLGFAVQQGKVLVLDNELHEPTFVHRIKQIGAALQLPESALDNLDVECYRGRLLDINSVVARLKRIPPGTYRLVILDSLYRFAPKGFDENSNSDTTAIYNLIDSAAAHLGCAIVCVRHSSKGSQSNKSVTDTGAGAGAQSRAADCHLVLRAHEEEGAFVLAAALRSFAKFDPFVVRFEWPVFFRDENLDPLLLAPDKARKPKAKEDAGTPQAPTWDAERFAHDFLTVEPQSQLAIIAAAVKAGLSERRASNLLKSAQESRLAFLWLGGDRRQKVFARVPQTTLTITSESAK